MIYPVIRLYRGFESISISTINFSIHGSKKRFYMKALGLNQAYILLKLRKNYSIVLICSFGSTTGNILQLNKKFIPFFHLDNMDYFRLILKTIWILKTILKITTSCGFSLIDLRIFWI